MGLSTAQSDSLVGSVLGKDYRVIEQIGMGGMAVVYLVEHQTLHKNFAVKVLSPMHAESEEARARFAQEAHSASQLDHENIITITDFGVTTDERPYFVMELLRGATLDQRIEAGPMTIEEVVAVSVPVARALAHAHAEGVIHRDVKPENVFLVQRSQGRWTVKVLDFGIAKVQVNPKLTKMGQALGSPMFMAPECCRGDEIDQRADIYSFGILLYLMLTGRVPFEDESLLKVLQMQVTSPLPLPSEFKPDLSPELEAVVVRALQKNPDDRYATMDEMLVELEAALPVGSDSLLIQAQFGNRDTPFPSQQAIRASQQNMTAVPRTSSQQSLAAMRASRNMAAVAPPQSQPLPQAPTKKRGAMIAMLSIGALALGGAGMYTWWYLQQQESTASAAAQPAPQQAAVPTPTPTPPAPTQPAPAAEPAPEQPAVAVEPATEPPPTEEPVVDNPKEPVGKQPVKKQPPGKKVAAAKTPPKTTPKPPATKDTGAAKPPTPGSATLAATPPEKAVTPPPAPPPDAAPIVVKQPEVPKVPEIGSMDANPTVSSFDVNGSLPGSMVRRAVDRAMPSVRACYQAAAKAAKATPAVSLTITFEIDENSTATGVSAKGQNFGSLASCVKGAFGKITTQQAPDVGTVHVAVGISFRPI